MQIAETVFHVLAILVLLTMAARYGLSREVQPYHADIIGDDTVTQSPGLRRVMRAVYLAVGAATLAVALGYAVLVFRAEPSLGFGEGYAFLMTCALALPMLATTYRIERATGVKTPWRPILIGWVLALIAYAL